MNLPHYSLAWGIALLSSPVWAISGSFAASVNKVAETQPQQTAPCKGEGRSEPSGAATFSSVSPVWTKLIDSSPNCLPMGDPSPYPQVLEKSVEPQWRDEKPQKRAAYKADLPRSLGSDKAVNLLIAPPISKPLPFFPIRDNSVFIAEGEQSQPYRNSTEPGGLRVQQSPAPLLQEPTSSPIPTPAPGSQLPCPDPDPDLGCTLISPLRPPPGPRQPFVYLIGRLDYFRNTNIFSGVDPVDDGFFRPGLTLFAAPPLGPNTFFVGSATVNLVRYSNQTQIDYNELNFEASLMQRLSPVMFGKLGWSNQQLFIASNKLPGYSKGTRFLDDNAIRLELSRQDKLGGKFSLYTFYQLRIGFAHPVDRSRVINSVVASLSYDIQPSILQLGLDYQFALATFTQQKREDQYQQIGLRLTYTAFRSVQINLFGGYSFGRSSNRAVNFDGLVLGISLGTTLALF
jgi:hypothetical protein